ncbi:MAG: DUF3419 family protein [Mariniblastus sp.]
MAKHIRDRADFDKIRYANCWEDADILVEALQPATGKRFLSIASAGDNSFSLLAGGSDVVAVDLSSAQLASVELRRESFRRLSYEEVLGFFGVTTMSGRNRYYQSLKSGLSEHAVHFWDRRPEVIADGFIHSGKFESYFKTFREKILPLAHSKTRISKLIQTKTTQQQIAFYEEQWNSFRWRGMFRMFFSRFVMSRLGRDPEFFRYVEGSVAEKILNRTQHALTQIPTSTNAYLRYILTGNFKANFGGDDPKQTALPHYLRKENFDAIVNGLDRLTLFHGSIQEAASVHQQDGFDGFNLSDIFEYLDASICVEVYGQLLGVAKPNARLAYWNMLVPRRVPEQFTSQVRSHKELSAELLSRDKAWFYDAFHVEEKI